MSQYNSRILVVVKCKEDWLKLSDLDMSECGFGKGTFDDMATKEFHINGDWSCFEDELEELVDQIAERIPNCLILADTNSINVDPYNFIAYYIGDGVDTDEVEGEMQWETYLLEPFDWFEAHGIELNEKQREYLNEFGFED